MILDERGGVLEAIAGTKPEVLGVIHDRWPGLPLKEVPHVQENPAGVPHHVEVTYTGRGEHTAFILDADGRELERFQASLGEVQSWLGGHYPGLPVRFLPLRNPAGRNGRAQRLGAVLGSQK